jgi:alkylation response protein AidB-like acyl-CoA dehydrogenase
MTDTAISTETTESVADFAARARDWLAGNMPRIDQANPPFTDRGSEESWLRARELQKLVYAGGFAGICFPRGYGGLGLDPAYQKAFDAESLLYEMPLILNTPTFTICAATILDMGSEEQKRQRISAAVRGDEVLVQLLSEPNGGSDLAGVITRADRRDNTWVINGAKTWSTSAFAAEYGLMLARTDWTVPKHEGLTMFLVPLDSPGITMRRIKQVSGSEEFCEEFFDGLVLTDDAVVGEVNNGWSVASRQLFHERRAVGGGAEFASGSGAENASEAPPDYVRLAVATGQGDDPRVQALAGRALVHRAVKDHLIAHVSAAARTGALPPTAGTLIRLFHAETTELEIDTALAIAGTAGVVDEGDGLLGIGERYLERQIGSLGGGSSEMARNVIGERILGFPREFAADRGVPSIRSSGVATDGRHHPGSAHAVAVNMSLR